MRNLLSFLLIFGSLSSFASWREATLTCDGIVSIDIPSEEKNGERFATLTKSLAGYRASVYATLPGMYAAHRFKLSSQSEVLESMTHPEYSQYTKNSLNMILGGDNSVLFGNYSLDCGMMTLVHKGPTVLSIEVLDEKSVYYHKYDETKPTVLNDIAVATLRYVNSGEEYTRPCSFKFYGE